MRSLFDKNIAAKQLFYYTPYSITLRSKDMFGKAKLKHTHT